MKKSEKKQITAAVKAFPGVAVSFTEYDEIRVNLKGGNEATAYYTTDAADAIGTARLMSLDAVGTWEVRNAETNELVYIGKKAACIKHRATLRPTFNFVVVSAETVKGGN